MELQFYTHVNTLIYYHHYTKYDAIIDFMNSGYIYNDIIEIVNNELNDAVNEINPVHIDDNNNPVNINIINQLINTPGIINQYQINTVQNQMILNNNALQNNANNNNGIVNNNINQAIIDNINNIINQLNVNQNNINQPIVNENNINQPIVNENNMTHPNEQAVDDDFFDNPPPPPKLTRH
jgi:hypothetical protein